MKISLEIICWFYKANVQICSVNIIIKNIHKGGPGGDLTVNRCKETKAISENSETFS